ncbi:hypothetical protein ANCCEY_03798 [Ancylostoma ceylanicum]|uniref:NR LBD domain-containing protein n=1 Tax=Ancylostoma ceylanicum TaxID=53326 RepID=A0A0D6MAP0_9BILA|nr:hypothetical protein ANCCEY_03798 [Ancylostoma ceylanicum]
MDFQGKIKLVTRQLCKIACLMISFWTYQEGYDGLLFGGGLCFDSAKNEEKILQNFLAPLADIIHTHIIPMFRKIGVTREEYLLLKAVVFFERKIKKKAMM